MHQKEALLNECKDMLYAIILLDNQEVERFASMISVLKEDGLKEIKKILERALKKQHKIFESLTEIDNKFATKLYFKTLRAGIN